MTRGEGPTRTRGVTWWIEGSRGRHWRPRKASLAVVGSADRAYQPVWPPGWLAGQPVDQYCHGYDVQRGGERREEASRWRLAGWLERERTGGGVVAHIPVTHERVENQAWFQSGRTPVQTGGGGVVDGGGAEGVHTGMYGGYNVVVEIRTTTSRDLHLAPPTQPATTEPFYSSDSWRRRNCSASLAHRRRRGRLRCKETLTRPRPFFRLLASSKPDRGDTFYEWQFRKLVQTRGRGTCSPDRVLPRR